MWLYVLRNQASILLIVVPVSKRLLFSAVKSAYVPPKLQLRFSSSSCEAQLETIPNPYESVLVRS
ncbi:MAG TPA: hypothetical protein DDY39_12215 [Nitrospira sp.]|nr:hypothetical protein [Nitrospira sp.]